MFVPRPFSYLGLIIKACLRRFALISILLAFLLPTLSYAGSDIKFIKNTKHVLYFEVPSRFVSLHCSPPEGDDPNTASFTYLTVELEDSIHDFIFRRPWSLESCKWRRKKMSKILSSAEQVRIFGIEGSEEKCFSDPDSDGVRPPQPKGRKCYSQIFEYLDGGEAGCHGYFEGACKKKEKLLEDWTD